MIQDTLDSTHAKLRTTLASKNHDYAGGDDEFSNFDQIERLTNGKVSSELGIFTRMSDKMSRLGNLLTGAGAQVQDESIDDTLDDLIGYTVILKARRAARKQN
jgi:hypothetical protein